jgi:Beta2-adaptin appendage, C-terminal sub-domain
MNALFIEDGQMDKRVFLATWKEIPAQNEVQYTINNSVHNTGLLMTKKAKIN